MRVAFEGRKEAMVRRLAEQGMLQSPQVIEAMRSIDRHLFVPRSLRESAYYDSPLSIGSGQTISAPHMVAMMLEYLDLQKGHQVLEIGGGSGYHAALVGHIVGPSGHVFSVERIQALGEKAKKNLEEAGVADVVTILVGDGSLGVPEHSPYDRIFVTCAAPEVPPPLLEELKVDGKLLLPLGSRYYQDLVLIEKRERGMKRRDLGGCVFVPLVGEYGF